MRPTFTEAEIQILIRAALLQKSVLADQLIQIRLREHFDETDDIPIYAGLMAVQSALDKLARALSK